MRVGDRVLWSKFITLNWYLAEWATVTTSENWRHTIDIKLDNPIIVGSNKTKVFNLTVPKCELKDFKNEKQICRNI